MADWCCLSPRAAQGAEETAEAEARKKLSVAPSPDRKATTPSPTQTHRGSAAGLGRDATQMTETGASELTTGMLPSNASPMMLAELEHAAQVRSLQKSPRRLSPARRSSRGPLEPASTPVGSQSSSSAAGISTPPTIPPATASRPSKKSFATSDDNAVKIILLGSGESGKSTFSKQMKVIHSGGFTEEEILSYRPEVLKNVAEGMQQVIEGMRRLGIQFGGEQALISQEWADYVADLRLEYDRLECLPQKTCEAIGYLWIESGIRSHFDRLRQVSYVLDSAQYFFDELDRFGRPDFMPTTLDILHARTKTTGITRTSFRSGILRIDLFDVGGQRAERKKWVQVFENATTVIFCVALSEYDQCLQEDTRQNRLMESFQLFDQIVNSRWFHHSSIVLFLNKTDIFRAKLRTSPLSDYFPEYTGDSKGVSSFESAVQFIRDRFLRLNRSGVVVYPFLTCATDTDNVNVVFAAVKETVLRNSLLATGLV